MSDESIKGIPSKEIFNAQESIQMTLKQAEKASDVIKGYQLDGELAFRDAVEERGPVGITHRALKADKNKTEIKKVKQVEKTESVLVRKEDADAMADEFSKRNREYRFDPRLLSQLAQELGIGIHEKLSADEMINLVRRHFTSYGESPDVVTIDKAFDFLLEFTRTQLLTATDEAKTRLGTIYQKVEAAKIKHFEVNAVNIEISHKIIGAVDAVAEKTGETLKVTLERYRDVVHNPPDIQILRKHFEKKGYRTMILELKGLSAYLGGNFKRVNLDQPELMQLANAARKMQAILNVFRVTEAKAKLAAKEYGRKYHDSQYAA